MKKFLIDYNDPSPAHICPLEIAACLARIRRWQGLGISVAQHSLRVYRQLLGESAEVRIWALLHDAHEAYLGDVAGPMCGALVYHAQKFDNAIRVSAGLAPTTPQIRDAVRAVDRQEREWERRSIERLGPEPCGSPDAIEREWLVSVAIELPPESPWLPIIRVRLG